jgi:hypothetical protein
MILKNMSRTNKITMVSFSKLSRCKKSRNLSEKSSRATTMWIFQKSNWRGFKTIMKKGPPRSKKIIFFFDIHAEVPKDLTQIEESMNTTKSAGQ